MTRASPKLLQRALNELSTSTAQPLTAPFDFKAQNLSIDTPLAAAEAASAALIAGAAVAGDIAAQRGLDQGTIALDSRHAETSLLSFMHLRFEDQANAPALRTMPEDRTAAAGFFQTADERWVYLHPGFPHNTAGLLKLLGTPDERDTVTRKIATLNAQELEDAIAAAGLCGGMVRSPQEWDTSSIGSQLGIRPVVEILQVGDSPAQPFPEDQKRPLLGINVLDLTRILAGPTCARTLASYGASVLRVGAEQLPSVPLFVADTGFGKRSCHLDLREPEAKQALRSLLASADVFSQGYRSGAMERLGFGVADVCAARPGMVYVSINCYGHEGPWRTRPGWEQLAQVVTGMAQLQGQHKQLTDPLQTDPDLLPAALNDYTTGYLAAYGALVALKRRAEVGGSYWVRVSLARTATWVRKLGLRKDLTTSPISATEIAAMSTQSTTGWGSADHLNPAVRLSNTNVVWQQPTVPLGSHEAEFG